MNKLTIFFLIIINFTTCFGQTKQGDSLNCQEFNFFYKDSIENNITFGDYEPTGFVCFDDASLIVSTQFSFYCSDKYRITDSLPKIYFEDKKDIGRKYHGSSGSVFKLNSNFEKKWEIIFREHRIMKIGKLPDNSIIVAGDRTDMLKFWMAHIDTSGKVLWQKEYKLKYSSKISNMAIDSLGNVLLLAETERIVPISISKYEGKKRVELFRPTEMENNIYLLKISNKGHVLWSRSLDKRKRFEKFGREMFINHNIFVSLTYGGFIKHKNDWIKKQGKTLYELNSKGRIIKANESNKHFQYHFKDNYYSCTTDEDTIILFKNNSIQKIPTDTLVFSFPKSIWIYGSFTTKDFIYLLGSKDHNLGYMVVQLSKDNEFISYWNDKRAESCELVDAIVKYDGTIIIIGKCFKKSTQRNNELITYINFTVLKKNGT